MTLKDIVDGKNYPIIEYRIFIDFLEEYDGLYDTLFGYCSYIDGKLEPLDGDSYYLNAEIEKYEEWVDVEENIADGGQTILTVWEKYDRIAKD